MAELVGENAAQLALGQDVQQRDADDQDAAGARGLRDGRVGLEREVDRVRHRLARGVRLVLDELEQPRLLALADLQTRRLELQPPRDDGPEDREPEEQAGDRQP
nr:hypothetical protein [Solirubrobacter soli]